MAPHQMIRVAASRRTIGSNKAGSHTTQFTRWTNSPPAVVDAQMKYANLQQYFERNFSVDAVRRYKPAPEPYQMAAAELGV